MAATPRHLLVPVAHHQQRDGTWTAIDTGTPDGLDLAYSPTTLVTALDAQGRAVSSSTKPDLMVRMLELLDIHDGHRVLEIGTGTGYNAALLTHRLGGERVFSVDVDAELVDAARARLEAAGLHPRLAARDGVTGWPDHGPYDRILATCSVPRVPRAWARQLVPDGMVLVDLKIGADAGNLVLLHRRTDRLEGRFTARWAAFMPMRHDDDAPATHADTQGPQRRRDTTAPAQPWNTHREVWLMAGLTLPPDVHHGYLLDPTIGRPKAATLSAPDGSRCEVDLDTMPAQVPETGTEPRSAATAEPAGTSSASTGTCRAALATDAPGSKPTTADQGFRGRTFTTATTGALPEALGEHVRPRLDHANRVGVEVAAARDRDPDAEQVRTSDLPTPTGLRTVPHAESYRSSQEDRWRTPRSTRR